MASATRFSDIPDASITHNVDGTNSPNVVSTSGTGALATQVQGPAADGATAVGNPVQIGGKDGFGNIQALSIETDGRLFGTNRITNFAFTAFANVNTQADGQVNNSSVLFVASQNSMYNGATWDRSRTPNTGKYIQLASSAAEQNIWTPAAGKKFRLMGFILTTDVDCNLTFRDNPTGALIFLASAKALVPTITPPNLINGFLSGNINRILTIQASAAATIFGTVFGCEE